MSISQGTPITKRLRITEKGRTGPTITPPERAIRLESKQKRLEHKAGPREVIPLGYEEKPQKSKLVETRFREKPKTAEKIPEMTIAAKETETAKSREFKRTKFRKPPTPAEKRRAFVKDAGDEILNSQRELKEAIKEYAAAKRGGGYVEDHAHLAHIRHIREHIEELQKQITEVRAISAANRGKRAK